MLLDEYDVDDICLSTILSFFYAYYLILFDNHLFSLLRRTYQFVRIVQKKYVLNLPYHFTE